MGSNGGVERIRAALAAMPPEQRKEAIARLTRIVNAKRRLVQAIKDADRADKEEWAGESVKRVLGIAEQAISNGWTDDGQP